MSNTTLHLAQFNLDSNYEITVGLMGIELKTDADGVIYPYPKSHPDWDPGLAYREIFHVHGYIAKGRYSLGKVNTDRIWDGWGNLISPEARLDHEKYFINKLPDKYRYVRNVKIWV